MQIHVVQRGQTLFRIAHTYGTTAEAIIRANVIPEPSRLVVGQALVIPITGSYHWVQPGETLYDIAKHLGVGYLTIAEANRIETNRHLRSETRLYIPPQPIRKAEIGAYAELSETGGEGGDADAVGAAARDFSYISPYSFRIQRNGTLIPPPLDRLSALADENDVGLIMTVTNSENGRFSAELGEIVLHHSQVQQTLLDHVLASVEQFGFQGVHFDVENLRSDDREAYHDFLRRAGDRLHAAGRTVSASLSPRACAAQQGSRLEAVNFRVHGETADYVVLKPSEGRNPGGEPMPASSFGIFRRVLRCAATEIPGSKMLLELNASGYDWTLPHDPSGPGPRVLSPQGAIELAKHVNAFIRYDYGLQAPYFHYIDEAGKHHQVWFEDARSIRAKLNLVKELGLRGVVLWKLGLPFPQLRLLIGEYFYASR